MHWALFIAIQRTGTFRTCILGSTILQQLWVAMIPELSPCAMVQKVQTPSEGHELLLLFESHLELLSRVIKVSECCSTEHCVRERFGLSRPFHVDCFTTCSILWYKAFCHKHSHTIHFTWYCAGALLFHIYKTYTKPNVKRWISVYPGSTLHYTSQMHRTQPANWQYICSLKKKSVAK